MGDQCGCVFNGEKYITTHKILWKRANGTWQIVRHFDGNITDLCVAENYLYVALEEK